MNLAPLLSNRDTDRAWRMFRHGARTDEIAKAMSVTEAEVANSLARARELRRLRHQMLEKQA